MRDLLKIYGKYIGISWAIILLLLAANAGVFLWIVGQQVLQDDPVWHGGISTLEKAGLEKQAGQLTLTEQGRDFLIKSDFSFLMVLNEEGNVIYSWNLPDTFSRHYTLGEVAGFTRWYLNGYPVKVWNTEEGLLVAGQRKDTLWKYNMELSMDFIGHLGNYFRVIIAVNLFFILAVVIFLGYRYYNSLRPLGEGIEALSANCKVHLSEKGVTSRLASKINQASDILEGQRQALSQRDMARTEWIAGVSHDIRTPLSIIVGHADELEQNGELSRETRDKLAVIKNQSLKIGQLIEDLNLTSKLEYHMQPLRISSFYPAALLRNLAAELINEGLDGRYELTLEIQESLEGTRIAGDEGLVIRALRNLLNNSIRHNPGGCRILLAGSRKENLCVLEVADDGCGIPRRVVEILTGENKDAAQKEGKPHVMGLRLVKQIALSHKGTFQIKEEGHLVQLALPAECSYISQ